MFSVVVIIFTFILLYRDYKRDNLVERSLTEIKEQSNNSICNTKDKNR